MRILLSLLLSLIAVSVAHGQQPRLATLAQQKMCAEQAKRTFNESDASQPSKDKTIDWCILLTPSSTTQKRMSPTSWFHESGTIDNEKGKIFSNSTLVYDAFEGRVYANYPWFSQDGRKYWEVAPMECSVKPRGQDEISCKSSDEFERLVDKHFGIGL